MSPVLHVALMNPEIGPNTGNIGRLCLGLGAQLHLIHPLGFKTDDKAVRRAGLDYWKDVDVHEHEHADGFFEWAADRPIFAFSTKAPESYAHAPWRPGCVLLFGPESKGLPQHVIDTLPAFKIPISENVRSLNLANAVAVVAYAAVQQLKPEMF